MTYKHKHTPGYLAALELVENLLDTMARKGVSRTELARKIGVDRSAVSRWFSPGRNLTVFTAAMIADALDSKLAISVVDQSVNTAPSEVIRASDVVEDYSASPTIAEGEAVVVSFWSRQSVPSSVFRFSQNSENLTREDGDACLEAVVADQLN